MVNIAYFLQLWTTCHFLHVYIVSLHYKYNVNIKFSYQRNTYIFHKSCIIVYIWNTITFSNIHHCHLNYASITIGHVKNYEKIVKTIVHLNLLSISICGAKKSYRYF